MCKNDDDFESTLVGALHPLNLHKTVFVSQQPKRPKEPTDPNNQISPTLQEELKIEREIIQAISSGKLESLKPNSGEAIFVGDNYVCVFFHEDNETNCRVWEWHGYVLSYSLQSGYTKEHVYGNYYDRLSEEFLYEENEEDNEEMDVSGLRPLIGGLNLNDWGLFGGNSNDSFSRT